MGFMDMIRGVQGRPETDAPRQRTETGQLLMAPTSTPPGLERAVDMFARTTAPRFAGPRGVQGARGAEVIAEALARQVDDIGVFTSDQDRARFAGARRKLESRGVLAPGETAEQAFVKAALTGLEHNAGAVYADMRGHPGSGLVGVTDEQVQEWSSQVRESVQAVREGGPDRKSAEVAEATDGLSVLPPPAGPSGLSGRLDAASRSTAAEISRQTGHTGPSH